MRKRGKIHIGTSGWHYAHWKGPFYPADMRPEDFLEFYVRRFHTVEINNSFYRLPDKKTFLDWSRSVPGNFIFSVKASRYITHMKKLKDPEQPVARFMENVAALRDKLGPVLFQLPPNWNVNTERLRSFLEALPGDQRYAFEFRDTSWFDQDVYDLLAGSGAAFCIYELEGSISPKKVTAGFVYVRLHGPGGKYRGQYDARTLSGWAGAFSVWASKGKDVYCYFDNDEAGYAAQDAMKLQEMVTEGNR
jgi:uncharacterized protein YecE (DUF72 family)